MKNNILSFFAFAFLILSVQSCKEDIDLIGGFTETAVIYGLLDQADSVHYVKITRAFIGPGNALEIAQIPDSNYFNSVNATVNEYIGGVLTRTWTLEDTMLNNKSENGVFYAPEQKLYYFSTPTNTPLDPNATYKLNIDINNGLFIVSGETKLVDGLDVGALANLNAQMNLSDQLGSYKTQSFNVARGNSAILNTTLKVTFDEYVGLNTTEKSFNWSLGEFEVSSTHQPFSAPGALFYERVKAACANSSPLVDKRILKSISIVATGGTEDLLNYILVNEPSSSLTQNKPTFTNLTASNDHKVIGIFSSRQTLTVVKPFKDDASQFIRCINKNSTAELCKGPITGFLLFCSDHSVDVANNENFVCN